MSAKARFGKVLGFFPICVVALAGILIARTLPTAWQIMVTLAAGASVWLFFTLFLIADIDPPDVYRFVPLRKWLSGFRPGHGRLTKYARVFAKYTLIITILFVVWLAVLLILYARQPNGSITKVWACTPLVLLALGIIPVAAFSIGHLLGSISLIAFYLVSLPARFGVRKLGVHGLGKFLESLGVIMIGFSLYLDFMSTDIGLTGSARAILRSGKLWCASGGTLCAALGGTYSIFAYCGLLTRSTDTQSK